MVGWVRARSGPAGKRTVSEVSEGVRSECVSAEGVSGPRSQTHPPAGRKKRGREKKDGQQIWLSAAVLLHVRSVLGVDVPGSSSKEAESACDAVS